MSHPQLSCLGQSTAAVLFPRFLMLRCRCNAHLVNRRIWPNALRDWPIYHIRSIVGQMRDV